MILRIHTMEYDYRNFLRIELLFDEGGLIKKLEFIDGEPEDNNLNRNFNDCYAIEDLVRIIADGEKEDVSIEYVEHESGDWDSWESDL